MNGFCLVFIFTCTRLLPHPAPCPPTNVQATFACEDLTAAVTWQQSALAVGYVAYVHDQNGHSTSCTGADSDTSCQVSGLMCGTEYNVWVTAVGHSYDSSDSSVAFITSGKTYFKLLQNIQLFILVVHFTPGRTHHIGLVPSGGTK